MEDGPDGVVQRVFFEADSQWLNASFDLKWVAAGVAHSPLYGSSFPVHSPDGRLAVCEDSESPHASG